MIIVVAVVALRGPWFADDAEPSTTTAAAVTSGVPEPTSATVAASDSVPADDEFIEPGATRGGFVTVGLIGELTTFNPLVIDADRSLAALQHVIGAAALTLDPTTHDLAPGVFSAVPGVADAGLTVNTDGTMTVRGAISPDAYWSDGQKITGRDFTHTYTVIETHRDALHPDVLAAHDRIVPGSLTVTAGTVEYTLFAPSLALHEPFGALVPAHAAPIESFLDDWTVEPWPSAGPFVVTGVDADRLDLAPNPEFRATADEEVLPKLDGLSVQFFASEADAVGAFGRGDIDVVGSVTSPGLTQSLQAVDGAATTILRGPGWEQLAFQFGPGALETNAGSVVDRLVIRRAIMATLDRQAIAEAVQGPIGEPMDSILGIGWPGIAEPLWVAPEERPGLLTGVTIVLATTGGNEDRETVIDLIRSQLEAAGATVQFETDEAGRFFGDMVIPGLFEVAEWAWVSEPGPAGTADDLLSWFTADGSQQLDFGNWASSPDAEEFAVLMTGVTGLLNIEDLEARLLAAERAIAFALPIIPLYAELNVAAAAGHVHGFSHSTLPGGVMATAWSWYAVEE